MSTPGFRGERLREVREARELSASALAGLLDVSRQLISDFELGHKNPSHETLGRISELLRAPRHYFTTPTQPSSACVTFYRSQASTSKAARAKAEIYLAWAKRTTDVLREHVSLPAVNFPDFDLPKTPSLSKRQIEDIATKVRREWGLGDGPIGNIVWLLENNGAVVLRREVGDEAVSAYSQWGPADDRPYFVLSTDKESAVRSRFDAAHELAHIILHRHIPVSVFERRDMFKRMEEEADYFAGAFLLPAATFASECCMTTLDMFRTLKPRWRVSIAAMIFRAAELGMVKEDEEKRLRINLTRRGWRQREPLDNELPPEEPRLIRRALAAVLDNHLLSEADLELRTALRRADIEIATGLRPGELGGCPDPFRISALQPRPSEPGLFGSNDDVSGADPIPFPLGRFAN